MPPMPSLFIKAVKDICTINTFELLNILFSEVNCLHFGFTTRLFPDTTNDLSIYELWKLFHRWPLVFGSFILSPLVARDVVTPSSYDPQQQLFTDELTDHPVQVMNWTVVELLLNLTFSWGFFWLKSKDTEIVKGAIFKDQGVDCLIPS